MPLLGASPARRTTRVGESSGGTRCSFPFSTSTRSASGHRVRTPWGRWWPPRASSTKSPMATGRARRVRRWRGITVSLHGSLAYTGIGHATDRAVILGLAGETPDSIDPDAMDAMVETVEARQARDPARPPGLPLRPRERSRDGPQDAAARPRQRHGVLRLRRSDGRLLLRRVYYSIGGGFVVDEQELAACQVRQEARRGLRRAVPLRQCGRDAGDGAPLRPFDCRDEAGQRGGASCRARSWTRGSTPIWDAMRGCIERGISQDGIVPGGLKVRRRAQSHPRQAAGGVEAEPPQPAARQ